MLRCVKRKIADYLDQGYQKMSHQKNIPPYSLRAFVGPIEEYDRLPQEYIAYFKLLCGLQMDHTVLDIGCGAGRFASHLCGLPHFFRGQYHGFDIDQKSIDWAKSHITPTYPNCQFQHVDLLNKHYNPSGKLQAENFSLPYPDQKFDLVFAYSIFTHLLPDVTINYLHQIRRVLKPGGKALLTFVLLDGYPKTVNEFTQKRSPRPGGPINWHHHDTYSIIYPDNPELILAYQKSAVLDMLQKSNLPLDKLHLGSWSEPENYLSFQDIIII